MSLTLPWLYDAFEDAEEQDPARLCPNRFDPETGCLTLELPLPPPDNACHRSSAGGKRYPTAAYKDWLDLVAPQLREVLGDWQPDRERWWRVRGVVWLAGQGDGPNYIKATLDLLSGAYVVPTAFTDRKGKKVSKGTILKPGAFWDDDRRVGEVRWTTGYMRHATPWLFLEVEPMEAPRDWKAEQQAQEREEKARAREAARQEREAARAAAQAAGRGKRAKTG